MLSRWPLLLRRRRALGNSSNGRGSDALMTRRGLLASVLTAALLAPVALIASGCGGGGGDDGDGGSGGTATVTGRLINSITGAGVAGATVAIGNRQTTTETDGSFRLTVAVTTGPTPVRINAPGHWAQGIYNNVTVRLAQGDITIPPLAQNQVYDLGTIRLYSTDSPPPPPPL